MNLIPYRYGGANFTTFRIISTTNYEWQQFNDFLQTSEELKEVESRVMNQERISSFKAQAIPFMFDECVNEGNGLIFKLKLFPLSSFSFYPQFQRKF